MINLDLRNSMEAFIPWVTTFGFFYHLIYNLYYIRLISFNPNSWEGIMFYAFGIDPTSFLFGLVPLLVIDIIGIVFGMFALIGRLSEKKKLQK